MSITLNAAPEISFAGPFALDFWSPPPISGVYVILAPVDRLRGEFTVIYIGEAGDLSARGFPDNHDHYASWLRSSGDYTGRSLYVAYRSVPHSRERLSLEAALIGRVNPPCNVQHRTRFSDAVRAALSPPPVRRAAPLSDFLPPHIGPRPLPRLHPPLRKLGRRGFT